jgi:hypothetical protein
MAIDQNNWGGVVIDPAPKKKSIILELDKQMNIKSKTEHGEETKAEKMARIKKERGAKLGMR